MWLLSVLTASIDDHAGLNSVKSITGSLGLGKGKGKPRSVSH